MPSRGEDIINPHGTAPGLNAPQGDGEATTIATARPTRSSSGPAAGASERGTAVAVVTSLAARDSLPRTSQAPFYASAAARVRTARRIVRAEDILNPETAVPSEALWRQRALAATRFHLALKDAKVQLGLIRELIPPRGLPASLVGTLLQPSGARAGRVQVEVDLSRPGDTDGHRMTVTNDEGDFVLALPRGKEFPRAGLTLRVHGANRNVTLTVPADHVAVNGLVGNLALPALLEPLPLSILGSLKAMLPVTTEQQLPQANGHAAQKPVVTLGEGQCGLAYHTDTAVDRFPFGVFVRLVEPRTSIVSPAIKLFTPGSANSFLLTTDYFPLSEHADVTVSYVDRVPVDQPISVDGFRDQLIGVGDGSTVSSFETVAMAGTLGLGYVVRMSQQWTPKGLSLGNLVYSLPLAPGEQQRVAIFERRDTAGVFETETFAAEERQAFQQLTEASTEATFGSAFNEAARGGSEFWTESDSWSAGGSIIIFSAGGGGSSSSGGSSSWLQGHRDFSSRAVEDVHTSVQRQAAASRRLHRTSMRLAAATESAEVTTKVITNHNRTRALTLQYWEVQRLYEVTTSVDGVTLVCLVPLEVVRFLPPGQPLALSATTAVDSRAEILERYAQVLKHADILERRLPRKYRHGLTLLRQFAADPTATFQTAGSAAEDVVHFSLTGTFLPFEEVYVSAVTKRGTRLGPVRLTGAVDPIPEVWGDVEHSFPTRDALMAELRTRRNAGAGFTLQGDLAMLPALARNDLVGFEVTRRFKPFDYDLVNPQMQALALLGEILGATVPVPSTPPDHLVTGTVRLSPQKLEEELGGPFVWNFTAKIHALGGAAEETYVQGYLGTASPGQQLPPGAFPIPALQLTPVLRYTQLLEIEQMLQHVVRNTVSYSKAVWQSLTAEERAILLEGFTIGVPSGGIVDESQTVPLLNCVENRVLGFYGNSMMMPFIIPRQVADEMGITSAQVQDTLTEFHTRGFSPPKSLVALPTRGVLGEAVLGHCPSAEKIDLTRFWNWSDSPGDNAPEIGAVSVPTTQPSLVAGAQGPGQLAGVAPLINNINANPVAPGADAALLEALAKAAGEQKSFSTELTGASVLGPLMKSTQEIAGQARSDAFKITRDLNAQAMATVGNILGGIYGGNPTAGSSAASSVYGTPSGSGAGGGGTGGTGGTGGGNSTKPSGSTPGGSTPSGSTPGGTTPGGGETGGGG